MTGNESNALPANGEGNSAEAGGADALQGPPKKKRRGSLSQLWMNTVGRAVTGAIDEASDTVVNLGADLRMGVEKGLKKVTKGGHQIDEDFLSWYETGAENRNPLKIGDAKREEWFGQKDKDSIGWAEDILQFTAGMVASGAALKGAKVAQVAAKGGKVAAALSRVGFQGAKAGFLADAVFMDPEENNLFDLIVKKAPDEQASMIQRAFASDPEDADTWNRLRAGINGFIVGKALDRTIAVVKYAAISRKAAKLAEGPAKESLAKQASEALAEAEKAFEDNTPIPLLDGGELKPGGPVGRPVQAAFRNPNTGEAIATGAAHDLEAIEDPALRRLIEDATPNNPDLEGFVDAQGRFMTRAEAKAATKAAEGESTHVLDGVFDVAKTDGGFVLTRGGRLAAESPVFEKESLAHAHAAALNEALPRADDELLFVAKTIHESVLAAAKRGDPIDAARLADGVNFNFHYLATNDGQTAWFSAVEEAIHRSLQLPSITNNQLKGIAAEVNLTGIRGTLDLRATQVRKAMAEGLAARAYLARASQYVSNLARTVESENMANAISVEKLRIALGSLADVMPGVRNLQNAAGQLLQSNKIVVPLAEAENVTTAINAIKAVDTVAGEAGEAAVKAAPQGAARRAPQAAGAFANMSEKEILATARRVAMADGDQKTLGKLLGVEAEAAAQGVKPQSKKWEWFNRLRYNSLLSGPRTHSRNAFSNMVLAMWRPIELGVAGVYGGDKTQVREAFDLVSGLWRHKADSFTMFGKAFKTGAPVLDTDALQEAVEAMTKSGGTGETYKMFGMELTRRSDSWLKEVLDLPSRLMMSADEAFKNLNYRASLQADAMKSARAMFPDDPSKWAQYADDFVDGAFTKEGGFVSQTAMEYAREGTLTRQLADGGWASGIARAVHGTPLKVVVPFVQTPINAFLAVSERTPGLWRLSRRMQADLAAGGRTAALAQAKIQMGQDLWTMAAGLTLAGTVTGGGPKDQRLRSQMMASGWRPYSVKIPGTDKWFEFRSIEPLGTLLGIAADVLESTGDLHRQEREQDLLEVSTAFALGVASNVTNKTFLRGLADFSNLLAGNEGAGSRWVAGLAGQMIPFGSAINQMTTDDTVREARSTADRIIGRTAFGNAALEPMRNIFGKEVKKESWVERKFLPFSISDNSDTEEEVVMRKIIQDTGGGEFIMVPHGEYLGLDLKDRLTFDDRKGQSPYDRLLSLFDTNELTALDAGVVNDSGKLPPLVKAMKAMVDEDEGALKKYFGPHWFKYAGWGDARVSTSHDISQVDTRKAMADDMVKLYKEAALAQVEREYPKLAAEAEKLRAGKSEARLGRAYRYMGALTKGVPATK